MSIASKKRILYPHTKRAMARPPRFNVARYGVGVYLDNAAATPIDPRVSKEMLEAGKIYGNPSSFNEPGRWAKEKLEESRLKIARFLGGHKEEIVFSSSGSEANNLAIQGVIKNFKESGTVITTSIEHPSILEPLKKLEEKGWKISYLEVNREGIVDPKDLESKLNDSVALISVMYANNEIGTIQPIKKMAKVINDFRRKRSATYPIFHTDACQATEYLDMNAYGLGVDILTFNGSKIYGPRGAGVLFKKRGISLSPLILGGSQENSFRAGTENLPAISGLAKALSLINKNESVRLIKLRDYFLDKIQVLIPEIKINGARGDERLPNNINISLPDLSSENLLLELDKHSIYASSGSACTSHSVEPSHVLKAIGLEKKYLNGGLRFSLGRHTTKKDIEYVLKIVPIVAGELKERYKK
jgi:cysteine desulfurase